MHIKPLTELSKLYTELAGATFDQVQSLDQIGLTDPNHCDIRTQTMRHLRIYAGIVSEIMNMQAQGQAIIIIEGDETHEEIAEAILGSDNTGDAIYGRDLDTDLAKLGLFF